MSGPRQELLDTGTLGPLGVDLLYRTVRQVVRMRNFPPPPGLERWTPDAVVEAAHDVFAARQGPARLLTVATRSTDEDSFRASLWQLVVNDLVSTGRRTERGRLSERLKDVLKHVPDLVQQGDLLRLTSVDPTRPEPRFDELVQAAAAVPITTPAWSQTSSRSAPVADRDSLVAVIAAVLSRSPLGLPYRTVVDVVAVRLGVQDSAEQVDHTVLDALAPPAADDPAMTAAGSDAGRRLVDQLTVAQQLVLPYLDVAVSVIAEHSGLGRTKAWETANATRLLLADLLAGDPSPAVTLREAAVMVRARWGLR